jgi:N-glycosylase/DNA lyase
MRDYKFGKGKHKSLTKATYLAIGDHFRELWGEEAGWAHSVRASIGFYRFYEGNADSLRLNRSYLQRT